MTIGNLILGFNSVMVSYLIHYDGFLQNATDITKCDSYFITKCDKSLLQNTSGFYYKMQRFCCKMQQLLQITRVQLLIKVKSMIIDALVILVLPAIQLNQYNQEFTASVISVTLFFNIIIIEILTSW